MKAYIIADGNAPDESSMWVVFADSEDAAKALFTDPESEITCKRDERADEFCDPGVTIPYICESPDAMEACDITPCDWWRCDNCDDWMQDGDGLCPDCMAEYMKDEQ